MASANIYLVTEDPHNYPHWDQFCSIEEALDYCDKLPRIFTDTETTGLDSVIDDLHCIQVGDHKRQFVIDWRWRSVYLKKVKKLLEKDNVTVVFHNAVFDLAFLYKEEIKIRRIYDSLVAEKCLTLGLDRERRDLASCVMKYCGMVVPKEEQGKIAMTGLTTREAIQYSGDDIYYLALLFKSQVKTVVAQGHTEQVSIVSQFTRVLAYIEYCGVHLNKDSFMEIAERGEAERYYARKALRDYAGQHYAGLYDDSISWSSPKQVTSFFENIGIDCTSSKGSDKKSANIKDLIKYADEFPIIKLYADFSKKQKTATTYGRDWLDAIYPDRRIHTKYNPLVSTGRTSCGASQLGSQYKNMQNVTNVEGLRECFTAYGNTRLINCDYSSQESVLFADQCQDPALLAFWQAKEGDMHSYVARLLWPEILGHMSLEEIKAARPDLRTKAKSAGFAIQYGSKGWSIAHTLNIQLEDAEDIYHRYMKAFPGMAKYFLKVQNAAFRDGYITINEQVGAKRYFYDADLLRPYWHHYRLDSRSKKVPYELRGQLGYIARQALNSPTQGTAALMSMVAGNNYLDWIFYEEKGFRTVKIVNFVHDEFVGEASVARVERASAALQKCMEDAGEKFIHTLKVTATPVESKVWGH